jgi:hypothetical protein
MNATNRTVALPLLIVASVWLAVSPVSVAAPAAGRSSATEAPAEAAVTPAAAPEAPLREVGSWSATGALALDLTAGSVRIVPGTTGRVRVLAPTELDHDDNVDLRADYAVRRGVGRLAVRARDEMIVTIEVPPSVGLEVRMTAGELEIGPIVGDKDLRLKAGELVVHATDADLTADAHLHVTAGETQWGRRDVYRGGLFRSYRQSGATTAAGGRPAELSARVIAGELRII